MDKIEISVEEYKHLKLCESFIDDNGYFWALEAFKDVVEHIVEHAAFQIFVDC